MPITKWESFCREAAYRAGVTIEEVQERLANGSAYLQISFTLESGRVVKLQSAIDIVTAALVALAEHGIPPDIQELLIAGDPMRGIAPGAMVKVVNVVRAMTENKHGG